MQSEVTLTVPLVGVAGCLANNDCNKVREDRKAEILLCQTLIRSLNHYFEIHMLPFKHLGSVRFFFFFN